MATTPKSSKTTPWLTCEMCNTTILNKDTGQHKNNCPPDLKNPQHDFIVNGALFSSVDVKTNEDIKNLSSAEKDGMVFLSQSVIQILNLCIGECVVLECLDAPVTPIVRVVWPTIEKSSSSVLFTKSAIDTIFGKTGIKIKLSPLTDNLRVAKKIFLSGLNTPKLFEISKELNNRIHKSNIDKILIQGNKISITYYGKQLLYEVSHIEADDNDTQIEDGMKNLSLGNTKTPYAFFKVTETTTWRIFKNQEDCAACVDGEARLQKSVGGLDAEKQEIEELMSIAFGRTPVIDGFKPARAVLLFGASGTGKTLLANVIANQSKAHTITISAANLYTNSEESVENVVKNLFEEAVEKAPSLVIIDEIDVLCPLKNGRLSEAEKRIMFNLLLCLDMINSLKDSKVFIIATSNKAEAIDASLRRSGRLDRELEIPVPNPKARYEILKKLLEQVSRNFEDDFLDAIAKKTHGFVGADLASLCSNALIHASRSRKEKLCEEDFKFALTRVRPSAMREVQIEVPNVKWSDIGGQEKLKLILRQAVEWPLKHPDSFIRLGITPPRGVLMFGPPGCSKTMIAKALATESGLNFLSIKGPELFSKWVGESERAVREIFRKARQVAPSVIFFDEIDALGSERSSGSTSSVQERVLAQLLTELDGVTPLGDVTVLAATNRPDRIDKALLRPGRLDRIVYVPLPDKQTRTEIFKIKLQKIPVKDVDLEFLVGATDGYSGAEVNAVCHEAAMKALEESLDAQCVAQAHFVEALQLVTPRTPASLLQMYCDYLKNQNKGVSS